MISSKRRWAGDAGPAGRGWAGGTAARRGPGLAVFMIDIDHFKRINDTYGHEMGDLVLQEVASVLRLSMRGDDLIARFGGEEFVAALPVAAPDQAVERAERIRTNLASRRILVAGRPIRVTVSIGVAYTPAGRPRSVTSLIAAADQGLYQAKKSGRDRIVFSSEARHRAREPITDLEAENVSTGRG